MKPLSYWPGEKRRVLVTGGAGFIGGALIRRLLIHTNAIIFNLDKCGYASDLSGIEGVLKELGEQAESRYQLLKVDLANAEKTQDAIAYAEPDIIMHLAAESHVDRSIDGPMAFLESNVIGTFNLLQATREYWEKISRNKQEIFRFHHISTDEVFGSLGAMGKFNEETSYDPRSPYSATKASSDHLVNAWFHTYGLPVLLTNCSNNYGPWQFPEKLIPVVIMNALEGKEIPVYGNGENIRDWLYVEDHIDALLLTIERGKVGRSYCIGGGNLKSNQNELTNNQVVKKICLFLDERLPKSSSYLELIRKVTDRPGHDYRYSIDSSRISSELGWQPKHNFEEGLSATLDWYLANIEWCKKVRIKAAYSGQRIGKIK